MATQVRDILFSNDTIQIFLRVEADGSTFLRDVLPVGASLQPSCSPWFDNSLLPLVEVRLGADGNFRDKTGKALVGGAVSLRLAYRSHVEEAGADACSKTLHVELYDEETGITIIGHLTLYDGIPVVRSRATIRNDSEKDILVSQVSSFVIGGMSRSREWWHDYEISTATNTWFREAQWHDHSLPSIGIDDFGIYGLPDPQYASFASYGLSNRGTFSSQGHLPMGVLKRRDGTDTWLWQVENNGAWRWDFSDFKDNIYLAVAGPTGIDHDWRLRLAPNKTFTTVPAAICRVFDRPDAAFSAITRYRRQLRREHDDYKRMPIIFNDFMNCLLGDPTEEKILALLDPVAESGAEYYVIDAGWYADESDWWDGVGLWEPSTSRFPNGFKNLLQKIQQKGLKVGLWLEPEVIGVRSVMASRLPEEAYFQRDGQRVMEKRRYQLDYSHPAVIKRMDEVIDNLIVNYGVQYFKFDYNIDINCGTDANGNSPGVGQLAHNRAYLGWVQRLLERYPGLVIENCSSGGQRMDYAMLSVHGIQSTSDQQDPVRYAAIAAGIHTAVLPEQGASWAYPQPEWSDEVNALSVVNCLLGRVHLSGRLDIMAPEKLETIVNEGMRVYKRIRGDVATGLPFWPIGLPAWHDDWVAQGLAAADSNRFYVAVWRRGGSDESRTLPIKALQGFKKVVVELLYPATYEAKAVWDAEASALQVTLPRLICARLFRLEAED